MIKKRFKNKTISIKGFICFLTVIMICMNNFAAVVSDNDGSAFITKAEYDSLKNNFQSQIDQYNTSIDSKIDGAISSYLAGIKVDKQVKLSNIYQSLGGSKIKFGKPDIAPTVNPVTGLALFFENGDRYGYGILNKYAGRFAIMGDSRENFWTTSGKGTKGQFIKYINDGNKYLQSYEIGSVEACYSGAWWTSGDIVNSTQTYPFGNGGQELGAGIICPSSTRTKVDSYVSVYREYNESEIKLDMWSCSGSVDTTANKVFLSTDNYKKVNARKRTEANVSSSDGTGNRTIYINNIDVYSWDTETSRKYDQLVPGFYYRTQYVNPLFGGVQLCKTTKVGKVKLENLSFNRYSNDTLETSGDVYFAISDEIFANQDDFMGNVRFTSSSIASETTEYVSTDNKWFKYKVPSRKEMTIEFECKENKTYYIKCQYDRTVAKNNKLYVTISDGAEMTATYQ